VLRAKNEASKTLGTLGKDLDKARASAELMGAQAQKAHLQSEQAAARNAKAHAEYAQRQLEAQKATIQAAQAEKQAELATLQHAQRVEALEKAHAQNTLATQRAAVQTQVYARQTMEAERAEVQRTAAVKRSQIATIEYATAQLQQQRASQQNEMATLRERQALDQNAISLLQNAKAHNDVRIAQLRSVEGSGEQIARLRDQNLMIRDQIATMRDSTIARQNDINAQQEQINASARQITSARALVENRRAEILTLQQEVNQRNQAIAAAKESELQSRKDIQVLEEQVRQRQVAINATQDQINTNRQEMQQIKERIQAKQEEIQGQRNVTSNMRQEIADRQALIVAVDREIASTKEANKHRAESAQRMRDVGSAVTGAGTAMTVGGALVLNGAFQLTQAAVDYEKATALTKTQVDDTGVSLKQLGDIGLEVARDFGVNFDDIQEAFFDIFSSIDATVPQAELLLRRFSQAAIAGNTDIKAAGNATIGVMNAWKIPIEDVTKVLDVQFRAVKEGRITYEDLANSLGRATPSAVRAGQSFETLSGILAYLTRNGSTAYNAVASAGRALDLFSNSAVVGRLKEMGINARDASGNFRPLADVVVELQRKLADLSPAQRAEEIEALFKGSGNNIQARRFWDLVLSSKAGADSFKDMVNRMNEAGGDLETKYSEMADTMAVRNEKMKNQWKALAVEAGEALFPALEKIVNGLSALAEWFNKLSPGQQSFLAWAVIIGGALMVVVGAVAVVGGGLATLISIVGGATLAIGALVAVVAGAFIAAWIYAYNKVEWFHDAVNAYVRGIGNVLGWLKDVAMAVWDAIVNLLEAAWRDIQTIWDALKAAARAIGDAWNWLKGVAQSAWDGILSVIRTVGNFLQGVWDAIMVGVRAVGAVFQWLLDAVRPVWAGMKLVADIWWAAMQVMFGLVQIALKALAAAWGVMGDMIAGVWNKIKEWSQAAWNYVQGVFNGWITFMKVQFSQAWDWISNKISDIWNAIKNACKAAWDWVNNNVFQPIINLLRGPLTAAWEWLRDKVTDSWNFWKDKITAGWQAVRDNVFTPLSNFVRNTIPDAFNYAVNAVQSAWNKLQDVVKKPVQFVVNTVINDGLLAAYNTVARNFNVKPDNVQVTRLAAGGPAIGPGGPTEDKIPAMLSNGEHVWTAKEVQRAGGHRAMERIRGLVMKGRAAFAAGGPVDDGRQYYPSSRRGDGPFDWITGLVGGLNPLAGAGLDAALSNPGVVLNKFIGKLSEAGAGQMAAVAIAAGKRMVEGVIKWIGEKVGFGSGDMGTGKFQAQPNGWPPHLGNQPPWSPNVQAAANFIRAMNPGMSVGSYVSGHGWSDHFPKAIDNMNNANIASERNRGNGLAKWFIEHPAAYGTKYVIWNKRITTGQGWGPYSVPGQGDHSDHVHLSFYKRGGAVAQQLMDSGGMLRPGMTNVMNATGGAERVLNVAQTQAFDRLVAMLDAQRANQDMGATGLAPVGGFGGGRSSNITLNVYTNEIDPRRHAMMLGMELEKAIG
jgi:TP901 family phage tail tape measure protein